MVNAEQLFLALSMSCSRYNVEVSGGLGPTAGVVWRVGLMGYNCSVSNVELVLRVLKEALQQEQRRRAKL